MLNLQADRVLADPEFARTYLKERVETILGKSVDSISLPMGLRPWRVNTMLSLDGFRVCIAGSSSGGRSLIAQTVTQFKAESKWVYYLKKVESLVEKLQLNPNYVFDAAYDQISLELNIQLYDFYIEKLQNSIFNKRVANPIETIVKGRELFLALSLPEQCRVLLNVQTVFGRLSSGCDLTAVGGTGRAAATVGFSANVSNWKKRYRDVRLIDASPAGLWEKRSENLLELL